MSLLRAKYRKMYNTHYKGTRVTVAVKSFIVHIMSFKRPPSPLWSESCCIPPPFSDQDNLMNIYDDKLSWRMKSDL